MNELRLIEQAKAGDKDAFCSLYGLYKDRLYRYAFYRLRSAADAEDAVSECVLAAWKQIGDLRKPEAFPGWLFRILSGCCGRLIRDQIRQRQEVSLDAEERSDAGRGAAASAGTEPDMDTRLILEEALGKLSEEERNIVLLAMVSGFKSPEIAEITGRTPGSVRSSLSRSLKKVRGDLL